MPSSTRVMATAGCMPTTTVSAPKTRDIAAMFASMRPMKESTISSEELSISTPAEPQSEMRCATSSCNCMASLSCMSTWMVISRNGPMRRIGILSISAVLPHRGHRPSVSTARGRRDTYYGPAALVQCQCERVRQLRLGDHVFQIDAEMNDGLRDLRPDAADDAFGAHKTRRRDGLQEMLCHQRIYGGNAGDV